MNVPQRFWKWADAYYGDAADTLDIEMLYDSAITIEENITLFKAQFPQQAIKLKWKPATETPTQTATISAYKMPKKLDLDTVTFVAILGDRHTGKTNLLFKHLKEYSGKRKVCLLGYPKKVEGFAQISNLHDLVNVRDAVVGVDELQKYFRLYDKRANEELMEFLSTARHSNITIVASTPLSQFITKGLEASVDVWNMTRIRDLASLKNGSKPKRVIQSTTHPSCNKWSLALALGEFLQYGEQLPPEENGVKTFTEQGIGKDW